MQKFASSSFSLLQTGQNVQANKNIYISTSRLRNNIYIKLTKVNCRSFYSFYKVVITTRTKIKIYVKLKSAA
jgi:hypothetical protein